MDLPAAISLATVLLALFLAISSLGSFFLAGGRQGRWFAALALSTCFYSGANGLLTLGVSDAAILAASRISIAAAAVHVMAWMHYGQRDLGRLARWPHWIVDAALLGAAAAYSVGGLTGRVVLRPSALVGVTYRVAEANLFGSLVFALLTGALALLIAGYAKAASRRVPHAWPHAAALSLLGVGAANDAAVTLGWSRLPYLLDAAFFTAVAILGVVMSRRWADDLRALDRALNARDDFIAIASHELKTPLTPLQLQLQLLRRKLSAEGNLPAQWLDEQMRSLARQVDRLVRLVNELLDLSRLERGKLKLEREEVDLADVVRDSVAAFEKSGGTQLARTIQLEADGPALGRWDRLRLSQVVTNLIDNALKYGEGKPIEVAVRSSPTSAVLSVTDRGIGIASEDQARIFRKFERAVPARHYGGLGLGLYITHQIVEALGGSIGVASRPGGGTTFTVTLPRNHESGYGAAP